jgi:uncharacterized glyoxalase superfamily protein PhnB
MNPNIFPAFRYRDADAAIAWLKDVFGFEEKAVHRGEDGVVHHAELRLGAGIIMLGQHRPDGWLGTTDPDPRATTLGLYVIVGDVDALYARVREKGAELIREIADMDYGSREFGALDLEGNRWSFGTYDPYTDQ